MDSTELKSFLVELRNYRTEMRAQESPRINKKDLRKKAESLGNRWFQEIRPYLLDSPHVSNETVEEFDGSFEKLIKLSGPNNLRSSYVAAIEECHKGFRDELLLPLQKAPRNQTGATAVLEDILKEVLSPEENDYVREAVRCAHAGLNRAAAVLGWCACIDRIHRKIDEIGFAKFNIASSRMASQTTGRFKRFNNVQNISSLGEIREVFDNIILWVIEGMQLIDSNQHTRLKSCFDIRCQSAHPGLATVNEYNLISFFSDINEIVLKNPKFLLASPEKAEDEEKKD
jgi:hypothetical protein